MVQVLPKWHSSLRLMAENNPAMTQAMVVSLILHLGLAALLLWGLPSFYPPKELQENINVVEILTVSDITNVRVAKPKAPKPVENTKKPSAAAEPKKALAEPVREQAPKVKIKPRPIQKKDIEPLPEAITKPEETPKPEEKKEEEVVVRKEEPQEDAFASVLKSVEEMQADEKDETPVESKFDEVEDFLSKASKERYQPGIPLSLSERDAVRQQIMRNWTVLGGARDAASTQVKLEISLARDGTVTNVEIVDTRRYNNDGYFRAMADSAVRAVQKSSPLQHLPAEKYDGEKGWQRMELNFDPSEMLY